MKVKLLKKIRKEWHVKYISTGILLISKDFKYHYEKKNKKHQKKV